MGPKSSMKNFSRAPTVCAASLFFVLPLVIACGNRAASGNTQAATPDLNGVWSAPFTPDISKALGHRPPFTTYGAARFAKEDEFDDPLTKCPRPSAPARGIQAGIHAVPNRAESFRFHHPVREPAHLSHHSHRRDGSHLGRCGPDLVWRLDRQMGGRHAESGHGRVGRQDLVDTAGHEHSDQLHLVERFQKVDNNNIKWTVTFEDPKFFTEPWSITLLIARQNTWRS